MEEYRQKEKERRVSRQLELNKAINHISESEEKENLKLKQELQLYKEKCQHLEQSVNTAF